MVIDTLERPAGQLQRVLSALQTETGVDFAVYRDEALRRAAAAADDVVADAADDEARRRFVVALTAEPPMFDDPALWRALKELVLPLLKTYPSILAWVPSCGTGETAWALAALLDDAGLLARTRIYATDAHGEALELARRGTLSLAAFAAASAAFAATGATVSLAQVFAPPPAAVDDAAPAAAAPPVLLLRDDVQARIVWAEHNVATDASLNEFQLVVHGGGLARLAPPIAARAHELVRESLALSGVVVQTVPAAIDLDTDGGFERLDPQFPIFRKRA